MKKAYIQFDAPKSDSQTAKDGLIKIIEKSVGR
jgi:hypothetical protein